MAYPYFDLYPALLDIRSSSLQQESRTDAVNVNQKTLFDELVAQKSYVIADRQRWPISQHCGHLSVHLSL